MKCIILKETMIVIAKIITWLHILPRFVFPLAKMPSFVSMKWVFAPTNMTVVELIATAEVWCKYISHGIIGPFSQTCFVICQVRVSLLESLTSQFTVWKTIEWIWIIYWFSKATIVYNPDPLNDGFSNFELTQQNVYQDLNQNLYHQTTKIIHQPLFH